MQTCLKRIFNYKEVVAMKIGRRGFLGAAIGAISFLVARPLNAFVSKKTISHKPVEKGLPASALRKGDVVFLVVSCTAIYGDTKKLGPLVARTSMEVQKDGDDAAFSGVLTNPRFDEKIARILSLDEPRWQIEDGQGLCGIPRGTVLLPPREQQVELMREQFDMWLKNRLYTPVGKGRWEINLGIKAQ